VTNISFEGIEGEALLMGLNKDIALSSGSACTSATIAPSYVLKAMGLSDELAYGSLRFGLGRFNTEEEINYVIDKVTATVQQLRMLRLSLLR
jgi:cysteine desulfurase